MNDAMDERYYVYENWQRKCGRIHLANSARMEDGVALLIETRRLPWSNDYRRARTFNLALFASREADPSEKVN